MHIHSFNKYKINLMLNKELKKNLVKFFLANKSCEFKSNKIMRFVYRNKYYYKYSSISFFRRSCILSGNCRSIFRFFRFSRYLGKYFANNGLIMGLRKSSF